MRGLGSNVAILSVLAAGASAATHKIEVGKGGLTFNPDTVKAAKGDVVEFHFDSNHNVVAGNFKKPCNPLSSGGFFSGDLPSDDNTVFSVTINNTEPIFYYCGVGDHCQDGMVGVINQGSDETLDDYKSAAEKASSNVSPKSAYGGVVSDGSSSSDSSSTGGSSSATATSESSSTSTTTSAATTSSSGAAGQLAGSVVGVSGLALALAGMLAF